MIEENKEPHNNKEEKTNIDFDLSSLEPHMAAVFAYMIPVIGGILFFIVEKKNKFVRFHAFQAILAWIFVWAVFWLINTIFDILPFFYYIGRLFNSLMSLAVFGGWLYLMWNAYNKKEYQLPYLGKIAREQVYGKASGKSD